MAQNQEINQRAAAQSGGARHAMSELPAVNRPASGKSVQQRLKLLVCAITLVGLLTGVLITFTAYHNEKAAVTAQLGGTARAISSALDMYVRELETLLKTLASSPELAQRDLAAFHRLGAGIVTNKDTWVVMSDANGQQIVNTRSSFGTTLPRGSVSAEEAEAFTRGETYTSDLFTGGLTKQHVVFVGIPVQMAGADYRLTIAMRPQVITKVLLLEELAPNATISIVDRKGMIVSRNRGDESMIGTFATPDMVRRVLEKRESVEDSVTREGVPVFAAVSRSGLSGWSVLVGVPKSESLASAHRLLKQAGMLAGMLLVFAVLISIWIGRSVIRGMRELVRMTERLSEGLPASRSLTGIVETDYVSDALYNTARSAAEREHQLAETKERLEQQVAARTSELAEANRQLLIANRELESFAHLTVNDLREPLRTISGYTSSLGENFAQQLPEEARIYSERIQNAATRMNRLLESIFAYSKVSAPRRELKPVSLNAVLDEVLGDLELRLRETGGRVVAGELGSVMADHADLHQLLLNLVGNALKFRRDGIAPVVEIESGRVGSDIHLVVKDNGIGFDPRHAEQIFAPFQRLKTEKRYEGTGMGLAIVRRIAERQGGSVHATSVPGAGSQFVVILRAAELTTNSGERLPPSTRFDSTS